MFTSCRREDREQQPRESDLARKQDEVSERQQEAGNAI